MRLCAPTEAPEAPRGQRGRARSGSSMEPRLSVSMSGSSPLRYRRSSATLLSRAAAARREASLPRSARPPAPTPPPPPEYRASRRNTCRVRTPRSDVHDVHEACGGDAGARAAGACTGDHHARATHAARPATLTAGQCDSAMPACAANHTQEVRQQANSCCRTARLGGGCETRDGALCLARRHRGRRGPFGRGHGAQAGLRQRQRVAEAG